MPSPPDELSVCCTDELSGNQRAFKLKHFFVVSFLQKQEVKIILWNALISPIFFPQRVLVLREARRVQLSSRALLLLCFGVQRVWELEVGALLRRQRGSVVSHGAGKGLQDRESVLAGSLQHPQSPGHCRFRARGPKVPVRWEWARVGMV